jgi:hypothetical protein
MSEVNDNNEDATAPTATAPTEIAPTATAPTATAPTATAPTATAPTTETETSGESDSDSDWKFSAHKNDAKPKYGGGNDDKCGGDERDMVGYGATTVTPRWPRSAKVALNFVINYEEGGEMCVLHGDGASECLLSDNGPSTQPYRKLVFVFVLRCVVLCYYSPVICSKEPNQRNQPL